MPAAHATSPRNACAAALAAALAAVCAWHHPAYANLAAPSEEPVISGDPAALNSTPISVRDESLTIHCHGPNDAPTCAFEARYALDNPTGQHQHLTVAFYGLRTRVTHADLNDAALHVQPIDAAQADALGLPPITRFIPMGRDWGRGEALSLWQLTLAVAPHTRAPLTVRGTIDPGRHWTPSYEVSANQARHPWMHTDTPPRDWVLHYLIGPIRTWGGDPPTVRLTVEAPRGWGLRGRALWASDTPPPADILPAAFTAEDANDLTRLTSTFHSAAVDDLRLDLRAPPPGLQNGGLLLGVGGRLDDAGGFRARLGYDVAYPDWLLYGIHLDSDLRQDLTLALMVEAASPSAMILPSLGLGVGPALQALPDLAAGVRAQVSAHWPALGLVTSFDIFPGLEVANPRMFQVTMLAQLGL
jgi:hypothetical protein